jgi:type II secretory pathway pseudopilin PulG
LLVVITIIGILAGFITGAAIRVRYSSRKAVIKTELSQLDMALQSYKQKHGEFPPDFANVNNAVPAVALDARTAVLRHLRKAFPRYQPVGSGAMTNDWDRFCYDVNNNYGINPATFDAASALVFWLGGLPETTAAAAWKPAGFHSDPQFPFKQGLPRTEPFFDFKAERLVAPPVASTLRYSPPGDITAPYVYFRAQRLMSAAEQYEYGYVAGGNFVPLAFANTATDFAVPYLDQPVNPNANLPAPTPRRAWRNQETFQIVCPGFDNLFGGGNLFRFSRVGQELDASGSPATVLPMNDANFDNIANFSEGTLEDEMQQ